MPDAVISVLTFGRNSKSRVQLVLSLLRFFTLERASRRVLRQKRRYVLLRRPRHRSHENGSNLSDPGVISVGNNQSGLLLSTTFSVGAVAQVVEHYWATIPEGPGSNPTGSQASSSS